jgi:glycosyltransferase involved in cell wall biosynthesis
MKIGIEAQRIFRRKKHGMDIVALELIRNLQKIDEINEYVVFVKNDEDDNVINETDNFRIVRISGAPYPYWEQVLLPKMAHYEKVSLLHCTSNTAPLNLNVPLVLTLHDIIYLEKWNFSQGSYYQILGNLYRRYNVPSAVRKAAQIITVSNFEQKRIQGHFGLDADHVKTVYNGVGDHFRRVTDHKMLLEIRRKYSLPENFIFFLGNTDPKKNVEGVLRALSLLKQQSKLDFKLVMPDIDRRYLQSLAEKIKDKELLEKICFTGYVANSELPAIYSLSEIFLYPSLRESFGMPILEAMACGVPVITSNTSSMPEVAGDAAVLIDPRDPGAIASAILQLRADKKRQSELSEKGLRRSARFSWEVNARQTLDIYNGVLNARRTSG